MISNVPSLHLTAAVCSLLLHASGCQQGFDIAMVRPTAVLSLQLGCRTSQVQDVAA